MKLLRVLLMLPSVVLLLAPYAWGITPFAALFFGVGSGLEDRVAGGFLAAPFFLAIPVLLLQLRPTVIRRMTLAESLLCHALAFAGLGCTVLSVTWGAGTEEDSWISTLTLFLLLLATGTILLNLKHRIARIKAAKVAIRVAWIPNMILCSLAYKEYWDWGAYLTLFTFIVFVFQITRTIVEEWRSRGAATG